MKQIQASKIKKNPEVLSESSTFTFGGGTITHSWIDNGYPVLVVTTCDLNGKVLTHEYFVFRCYLFIK